MGRILHHLGGREHPDNAEALLYAAYALYAQQGPWAVLQWLRGREAVFDAGSVTRRADILALRARLTATLRDFTEAEKLLSAAESLLPDSAWIQVERSFVCEMTDDYDGALLAAQRAMMLRPGYRPAIEQYASTLRLLNRDDEALAALSEGASQLESSGINIVLLDMQMERALYPEAEITLARIEVFSPLSDKLFRQWLAGRRADLRYHLGDRAGAASQARLAGGKFYLRLAERLEQAQIAERRVLLDVDFVRQHHMTCAPATLSALARYWQQPAEHLSIAEAICYDGSSDQAERAWAEQAGWHVREFTVTWEVAVALLDRGIPFALSAVEPGSAHMQAVIGYDNLRGSFLIRDPFHSQIDEFSAEPTLERYCANGPRGMLMIPASQAACLDGLVLLDAELYDDYYALQTALLRHDRARAIDLAASMAQRAPEHRMTLFAQRALSFYDDDEATRLRVTDALLLQYPQDVNLRLARQGLLSKLGRREQCLGYLRTECTGPNSHPLLYLSYAELLRDDARELDYTRRLLRCALRQMSLKAEVYYKLAHVSWDLLRREEALELYRTATSLEITDERYAESYFKAARYLNQTADALEFLTRRFERWGRKSAQPAMTLFESYDALEQTHSGLDVLEQALIWRAEDGELLMYVAEAWGRNGDMARAEGLLARAEPLARRVSWLQSKARLTEGRASLEEALVYWEQVAQDDPFNLRAVRSVVRLRGVTRSPEAALAYIEELAARFPHHHGLNRLRVEWLDDAAPEIIEAALRQVLAINPADAWSWRKLALNLAAQHRLPAAFEALAQAHELAPHDVYYHTTHARLLIDSDRNEEARAALREALRLSVDIDSAIEDLLRHCRNIEERRSELAFVHAELVRQVTFGDGLLYYREAAHNVLDPQELLAMLRVSQQQRPDLWHAWVALARQLRDMSELDQALSIIRAAAERFPLLPLVWVDMAKIERLRANSAGQEAALRQALAISPAWSMPARALAELYQGQGRFDDARVLLNQSLRHNPRDGVTRGWLADVLWLLGERESALDHFEQALHLKPDYSWAWNQLTQFATEHGQGHRPLALAQALTTSQPRNANCWLLLARAHDDLPAALLAIKQALQLDPCLLLAHEFQVDLLLRKGDFAAAFNATESEVWHGNPPPSLRLRRARIQSQQGDKEVALSALKALLAVEPNYAEAWEQLVNWHDEADRQPEHLVAAREMVRLGPGESTSHGYLADALLKNGERGNAKQALRRALELNPAYSWALNHLFDLELEDKELEAAGRTLAMITTHAPAENSALARLRLASVSQNRDEAVAAFEALAATDSAESELFDRAVAIFKDAGELDALDALVTRLVDQPDMNPQLGRLWVERTAAKRNWFFPEKKFEVLFTRGAIGSCAAAAYLRKLARKRNSWLLPRFLRKYDTYLRADTNIWALGGYALLDLGLNHKCARWLNDWREREGVKPWMLLNLALALRDLRRHQEANAVSEHALSLNVIDSLDQHRLLLAVDVGLAGDSSRLAQLLAEIGVYEVSTYYQYLHEFALALSATLDRGDPAAFNRASQHFHNGVALMPYTSDSFLSQVQKRTLWRIADVRSHFLPLTLFWCAWVYLTLIPHLLRPKAI
jgi:tetratricopeptide (TPR) repeat protein